MAHCFKHMDKNNKNQIWLQMEYKRAAVMLPLILKRAGIFAAVCLAVAGMLVFCAGVMQQGRGEAKLKVGYTAPSNQLTDLAVSYVQSMESIQSICSLEAVTEQEGRERLENGELSAWIVLPEDLINEILSGSNAPATLYLRESAEYQKNYMGEEALTCLVEVLTFLHLKALADQSCAACFQNVIASLGNKLSAAVEIAHRDRYLTNI